VATTDQPSVRTRTVATADGRSLTVREWGDPRGAPILFHHGTPSTGTPFAPHVELAVEQGVRGVAYDRPGYGTSTRAPGRAVVDAADDTFAIADALGMDRFATWGASGGGPHALACAARGGERVVAVATMAGAAPARAPGFDFWAGMGDGNIREFGAAERGEAVLRPLLEQETVDLQGIGPPELVEHMRPHLSDVDARALEGDLGAYLLDLFREAVANGVDGWVDDDLAFIGPWGFDPRAIEQPALVMQGRQDRMVPFGHGEWLARAIPHGEARLLDDEGHLTLFANATGDVNEWLRDRLV
jgi:pimeloyl-ACP methyl ester carboxylesterase